MNIVLLGPPGSGRNTQAKELEENFGWLHLSMGHLIRKAIKANSPLGKEAKKYTDAGELVPDRVIYGLISEYIRKEKKTAEKGIIFNGFPKTREQGEALGELLGKLHMNINVVVEFKIPDSEIVRRLSGRKECGKCGATYHDVIKPPKNENSCDVCRSYLEHRRDDEPEVVQNRLAVYHEHTVPLIEFYRHQFQFVEINASQPPELVFKTIVGKLGIKTAA